MSTSHCATVYPHWPLYCTRSASRNCTRKKFQPLYLRRLCSVLVFFLVFSLAFFYFMTAVGRCYSRLLFFFYDIAPHSVGIFISCGFLFSFLFSPNSGSDPVRIKSPPELADQTVEERLITFDWDKNFHTFQEATRRGAFRPLCWGKTQALIDVSHWKISSSFYLNRIDRF